VTPCKELISSLIPRRMLSSLLRSRVCQFQRWIFERRVDFDRLPVVHSGAEAQAFGGEILRRKLPPLTGEAEDHPHQVNCSCGVGSLFEGTRRVYINSVTMLVFYFVMGYACFQRVYPSTLLTQPYPHRNSILMTRSTSRRSTAVQKPPASSQPQS
jgi:hypothetical protein